MGAWLDKMAGWGSHVTWKILNFGSRRDFAYLFCAYTQEVACPFCCQQVLIVWAVLLKGQDPGKQNTQTFFCVWCWLNHTVSLNSSHFTFGSPSSHQVCYRRDFLLGSASDNPSWSVYSLISSEILNKWHLNSRKEPTVQIGLQLYHRKPSCLKQVKCWLIKEEQVKWRRSKHWWLFLFLCSWFQIRNCINIFLQKLHLTSITVAEMKSRLKR